MAPHSSTLAWKIQWTEESGRLQSMVSLESDTTERLHFHFSLSRIGEGNGNPLQCSFLENPRDGGAWWAAVYGVAQSPTRLKWLSIAFFNWRIIALQNCVVSAKHQYESAIGIHMSPPSWISFPSRSPSHPSRLLQSPGLSSLSHTANSHWLSNLHMVM